MIKLKKIFISIIILNFMSCSDPPLPESIMLENDKKHLVFTIKDFGYESMYLGTDAYGKWDYFPMTKLENSWFVKITNPNEKFEYKFYFGDFYNYDQLNDPNYWFNDSTNILLIKVEKPFKGYNSVFAWFDKKSE